MKTFEVEIVCQHCETRTIKAKSKKEALRLAELGEYNTVTDWHIDGNVVVETIKEIK